MEEFIYYNNLFDIYEALLTEKERVTFRDYYHEDLSLSEIASEKNVSRSAVYKTLKNVIDKLNYYEDNLHIYKKKTALVEIVNLEDLALLKNELKEILDM